MSAIVSSKAAGKRKTAGAGESGTPPRAALDAARAAELQMHALQARNDTLEMANKALDKSRNSLGCQLAYLDRVVAPSLDQEHKEIWLKIRRDAKLVAADAQAAADEDEYNRVAQLGPPERVLGCPAPPLGEVEEEPPSKKLKAFRPPGIVSGKNVFTKTYTESFKAANPGFGKDHLAKLGEAWKQLPADVKQVFRIEAGKQAEANAKRRSRGEATVKALALAGAPATLEELDEAWAEAAVAA